MRKLLLTVLVGGTGIGSGFGMATALSVAGEDPVRAKGGPSDEAVIRQATAGIRADVSADPRGGPPWAVTEYETEDGRLCAKPGRKVGDEVGALRRDGRVVGTSLQVGGDCVNVDQLPDDQPFIWHASADIQDPASGRKSPVSFIWGLTRSDVRTLRVTTAVGERTLRTAGGRAFITVLQGHAAAYQLKFTATLADGSTVTVTPPAVSERIRQHMLNPPEGEALKRDLREKSHPNVPGA